MGTDIHLYVEKRQPDGCWVALKGRNPEIDYYRRQAAVLRERGTIEGARNYEEYATKIEQGAYERDDENYASEIYRNWIYEGRNYNLFSILANVRNGYGFAGVLTGAGFKPIAEPRGLPGDVSNYVKSRSDEWGCDGRSHSHFSLADLLGYDWSLESILFGEVDADQYSVFKSNGRPNSWCGGVGGLRVRRVDNGTMEKIISGEVKREEGVDYYTRVQWSISYHQAAGDFYTETIPKLKELAGDDPTSVRIVFWFDN